MVSPATQSKRRPRELRRRVAVPGRVRTGEQWADACNLNISSRGMLIQSARPLVEGSFVEVSRGDQSIEVRLRESLLVAALRPFGPGGVFRGGDGFGGLRLVGPRRFCRAAGLFREGADAA